MLVVQGLGYGPEKVVLGVMTIQEHGIHDTAKTGHIVCLVSIFPETCSADGAVNYCDPGIMAMHSAKERK